MALSDGDAIAIAGPFAPSLAGSELAKLRAELGFGLGEFEAEAVREAIENVRAAVRAGRLRVVHDVSDGGLACALAECAIAGAVGLEADLWPLLGERGGEGEEWLFGEGPGGFVVAGEEEEIESLVAEGMALRIASAGATGSRSPRAAPRSTSAWLTGQAAERLPTRSKRAPEGSDPTPIQFGQIRATALCGGS